MFENFADLATAPCLCCTIGDLKHFSVSTVVFHVQYLNKMDLEHCCLFCIVAFPITLGVDSLWTVEIKSKADFSPFQSATLPAFFCKFEARLVPLLFSYFIWGAEQCTLYVQVFWKFEVWLLAFCVQLF